MADQPRRPRTLSDARSEAEAAFKRTTTKVAEAPPKTTALPGVKELVSLRLDRDVIEHFRKHNILIGRHFPPLDTYIRVSLGSPEEMRVFWQTWDLLPWAKMFMHH